MNQFEVAQGFIEQCRTGAPVDVPAPVFQRNTSRARGEFSGWNTRLDTVLSKSRASHPSVFNELVLAIMDDAPGPHCDWYRLDLCSGTAHSSRRAPAGAPSRRRDGAVHELTRRAYGECDVSTLGLHRRERRDDAVATQPLHFALARCHGTGFSHIRRRSLASFPSRFATCSGLTHAGGDRRHSASRSVGVAGALSKSRCRG